MHKPQPRMVISSLWFQVALLTFLIGFAVMGYMAIRVNFTHAPIPAKVVGPSGDVLFTGDDVMVGQHTFQRYGLMQLGTLFGHGAYLGPDFTAQYLHQAALSMIAFHEESGLSHAQAAAMVKQEFKSNFYNTTADTLSYTASQVHAFNDLYKFYGQYFGHQSQQQGPKRIYSSRGRL